MWYDSSMASMIETVIAAITAPIALIGEVLATTITLAVIGALESIVGIIPGSKN